MFINIAYLCVMRYSFFEVMYILSHYNPKFLKMFCSLCKTLLPRQLYHRHFVGMATLNLAELSY